MPRIRVSEVLPFTQEQIYNVVVDVERYPEFLPWCTQTRIFERQENQFMAELTVSFKGIREKFKTIDVLTPYEKVEINLRAGPFKYLASTWDFTPVGARTRVDFYIDFSFQSRMKEMLMGPVFTQVSKQMVAAFRKRALTLYKKSK